MDATESSEKVRMAIPTRQSLLDCRQSHIRQIAANSDQQAFPAR